MPSDPPETIALRREIFVAIAAFFGGFVVMLATLVWLIVHFAEPGTHWWTILHMSINAILISVVFGGLGSAALSSYAMNWYHHWRGYYRCRFCDKRLKRTGNSCDCAQAQALRQRVEG